MNDKLRLVILTGWELDYFFKHSGDLGVPHIHAFNDGPPYLVDADELRAWRASQNTSKVSE